MSTYEKIASALIAILLILGIVFSYHEIKEPEQGSAPTSTEASDFDTSLGQDFKIGPFTTIASEQASGGLEDHCELWQPVIIAALHDIKEHLETQNIPTLAPIGEVFEVNEPILQLFCNKNAEVILADSRGNKLVLQKVPFTRALPPQSTAEDIGTEVRINARVVPAGAPVLSEPTYGDILIPDRFLDTATSSSY